MPHQIVFSLSRGHTHSANTLVLRALDHKCHSLSDGKVRQLGACIPWLWAIWMSLTHLPFVLSCTHWYTHTRNDTQFLETLERSLCRWNLLPGVKQKRENRVCVFVRACARMCVRFPCNDWAEVFMAEWISERNGSLLQLAHTGRVNDWMCSEAKCSDREMKQVFTFLCQGLVKGKHKSSSL